MSIFKHKKTPQPSRLSPLFTLLLPITPHPIYILIPLFNVIGKRGVAAYPLKFQDKKIIIAIATIGFQMYGHFDPKI